ncbi:uncharacterized protein M8220_017202 [Acridotheres tristis]
MGNVPGDWKLDADLEKGAHQPRGGVTWNGPLGVQGLEIHLLSSFTSIVPLQDQHSSILQQRRHKAPRGKRKIFQVTAGSAGKSNANSQATFDGSGGSICAGRVGGIAVGDVAIGEAAGGCIVKKNGVQRVKRSEPLVAEQVELLRE